MAISTGAAILGSAVIGGAVSSRSSRKAANKAAESAQQATDLQAQVAREQLDFAKSQWDTYQSRILPIEIEASRLGISAQRLAQQRGEADFKLYQDYYLPLQEDFASEARTGIQPQYDRVARDAAIAVDNSYERQAGLQRRELERRGVRPDSGQYQSIDRGAGLAQAATRAQAITLARERERDRVEDSNFNRMAVALGRQPFASAPTQTVNQTGLSPTAISNLYGTAGASFGNAANGQVDLARMNANAAAGTVQGALNLGAQAYQFYNQFKTPTPQASAPVTSWGGGSSWGQSAMAGNNGAAAFQPASDWGYQPSFAYADGGPVTLSREPASQGGQVYGPPGRDQVPAGIRAPNGQTHEARLMEGEYVIPTDVVMAKGQDFFDQLIQKYHRHGSGASFKHRRG